MMFTDGKNNVMKMMIHTINATTKGKKKIRFSSFIKKWF